MNMSKAIVECRTDLPGGLPAAWVTEPDGTRLYLRRDLPDDLVDHFRAMCLAPALALAPEG